MHRELILPTQLEIRKLQVKVDDRENVLTRIPFPITVGHLKVRIDNTRNVSPVDCSNAILICDMVYDVMSVTY